jgi:hypothetical protein
MSFPQPGSRFSVREWTGDTSVAIAVSNGRAVVNATVSAFDVRAYVFDTQ